MVRNSFVSFVRELKCDSDHLLFFLLIKKIFGINKDGCPCMCIIMFYKGFS